MNNNIIEDNSKLNSLDMDKIKDYLDKRDEFLKEYVPKFSGVDFNNLNI